MMRRNILFILGLLMTLSASAYRPQMTPAEAWRWQQRVGVLKGFNAPSEAYPGQPRIEILQKAKEMGFNSVRFWVGGENPAEQVKFIREMIADADACGMTVSPVLSYVAGHFKKHFNNNEPQPMDEYEKWVRAVVGPLKDEQRIVFWDLWNEPRFEDRKDTYDSMDILEQMVEWCRDEDLSQPITSSIIWATLNENNQALKRTTEIEAMMDIHNFHSYDCALDYGKSIYETIDYLKKISDRPLVATECLTRVNGSGISRSFAAFAPNSVNFYIWGLYVNDHNWEARWERSTYDAYDPMFHNVLYSDGYMYDAREIEMIRNYRFTGPNEDVYPPMVETERWNLQRAWRWMVTGPIKGRSQVAVGDLKALKGYNAATVRLNFSEWKNDSAKFFRNMESMLKSAAKQGISVVPTLLTDADASASESDLREYVGRVIRRYYFDVRIKAWDLYHHPGKTVTDKALLSRLVTAIFEAARNQYPNQPVTMTPVVSVKPFAKDFDYWKALVHGRIAGWDKLEYSGGSSSDLVYQIWSLSDVTSFSSSQPAPETGWLASICYRFGRPIFCTEWTAPSNADIAPTLDRFGKMHVFWFGTQKLNAQQIGNFKFEQTSTQRQITEGM